MRNHKLKDLSIHNWKTTERKNSSSEKTTIYKLKTHKKKF